MYNLYGFGKRIASFRKLSGLTQEELASRLNITAQAVSKWENEISFPEITMLPQLAKELNTTIEQLFGVEEEALKGMVGSQNNGRVIEKSIERHSRRSTVQVLKRG